MADIENEESLLLAFKESGVEFVEDAGRAVGKLGDQFKDVDKTAKQAADVLKETSNVTQGLKDKIRDLKGELENLKDAFRSGLIESKDAFIERAGDFESGIARHKKALKLLEGDDDTGGLKGTASAAIKAEKAIGALVSGSGLGRLPGMLEGVTGGYWIIRGARNGSRRIDLCLRGDHVRRSKSSSRRWTGRRRPRKGRRRRSRKRMNRWPSSSSSRRRRKRRVPRRSSHCSQVKAPPR